MGAPIDVTFLIGKLLESSEEACPHTLLRPAVEARRYRTPVAVARREIAPRSTGTKQPEDSVQEGAIVEAGTTAETACCREVRLEGSPLLVSEVMAMERGQSRSGYRPIVSTRSSH